MIMIYIALIMTNLAKTSKTSLPPISSLTIKGGVGAPKVPKILALPKSGMGLGDLHGGRQGGRHWGGHGGRLGGGHGGRHQHRHQNGFLTGWESWSQGFVNWAQTLLTRLAHLIIFTSLFGSRIQSSHQCPQHAGKATTGIWTGSHWPSGHCSTSWRRRCTT